MIGNDIVDLQLARTQSNWKRRNFLSKIFTLEEQMVINQSASPEIEVWKLWSRKEAVYKIYNRQTGIRGFFPWKLKCSIESYSDASSFGSVSIDGIEYYTKTNCNVDFIYTIAANSLELFDRMIDVRNGNEVIKIDQLPYTKFSLKPVSISHHGRFERKITLIDS